MNYEFRKKPVLVQAFQMTEERRWDNSDWPEWLHEAWNKGPREGGLRPKPDTNAPLDAEPATELMCGTLEGAHVVSIDDWIIRGVKGELYPCKPDVFEMTYEEVR